jgi:uncharacterized MAPEG superfamily protein
VLPAQTCVERERSLPFGPSSLWLNTMTLAVRPELFWLAAVCLWTALLWVPYIVNRVMELGPPGWQWFAPADPAPRAAWAARAVRVHLNAIENLVVFAPLALAVVVSGLAGPRTALACAVYFWARVAHAAIGWTGAPMMLRTTAFLAGVAAQVSLAAVLLMAP